MGCSLLEHVIEYPVVDSIINLFYRLTDPTDRQKII